MFPSFNSPHARTHESSAGTSIIFLYTGVVAATASGWGLVIFDSNKAGQPVTPELQKAYTLPQIRTVNVCIDKVLSHVFFSFLFLFTSINYIRISPFLFAPFDQTIFVICYIGRGLHVSYTHG